MTWLSELLDVLGLVGTWLARPSPASLVVLAFAIAFVVRVESHFSFVSRIYEAIRMRIAEGDQ